MAASKTIYYDLERNIRVTSDGQPTQELPFLVYQSYEDWEFVVGKMIAGVFTAENLSAATQWECSVFTDWVSGYVSGALTAGFSGAVTSITADGFASAPPAAGYLLITNGAGEQDAIFYTERTLLTGVYTFTVSATLAYTYLENDVCASETSPPSVRILNADIDSTGKALGEIVPTFDTDNPVFLSDLGGERTAAAYIQIKGFDGSANRLFF